MVVYLYKSEVHSLKALNKIQTEFLERLERRSWSYQQGLDNLVRKQLGAYYTHLELTNGIISSLFCQMNEEFKSKIWKRAFFEPCLGIGNFVFSYLKYIYQHYDLTVKEARELVSNIYVCDSDSNSKQIFLELFEEFLSVFFGIELPVDYKQKNVGDALIFDIANKRTNLITPYEYFGLDKFDIVVTNPPYKGFRAELKHYHNKEEYEKDKQYYMLLKKEIKINFQLQGKGSPNLYKLFVEEIIRNYVRSGGYSSLLIPQSILKDQSSTELRKWMLCNSKISQILNVDESSRYVDANQALTAVISQSSMLTTEFEIIEHYDSSNEMKFKLNRDEINENINSAIVSLSPSEREVIKKMHSFKRISEIDYIVNLRGEFDLTINKSSITSEGENVLLRGRNLGCYELSNTETGEFVAMDFINNTKKNRYIHNERIACQQISNMSAKKRLIFSYVPSGYVLGNSCNFIFVDNNQDGVDIYYLLGLLNSDLYDWYFRIFSSNNHINNYEIDSFPIPVGVPEQYEISSLTREFMQNRDNKILAKIEDLVRKVVLIENRAGEKVIKQKCIKDILLAYPQLNIGQITKYHNGILSDAELTALGNLNKFDLHVIKSILEKYDYMNRNEVLNHTSFKLSDLDMEMIISVSPGGNWKEIPIEIAQKSKRLMRIRETGGRTTLYGRLDYSLPSYTITTYFNRPGNGTNIHPVHHRVLTVREAARIQSFPDDYFFYGNKKNKLNQIGNAVPPLMAYQIAKKIKEVIDVGISLDLFNGAGGMTTGFRRAGYRSIMMNDIDEAALITAKTNYPEAEAFLGDMTLTENREHIVSVAVEHHVDIVNGGPPCQGFSMAGFRNPDDPRSKLIFDYVEVLRGVCPKVFVFENVSGLLSHEGGKTFKALLAMFDEVGYKVKAKLLDFSDYGIPQKRKRVIIIGVRKEIAVSPDELFPIPITVANHLKATNFDAISDLEHVPVDNKSFYASMERSEYQKMLRNEISEDDYINRFQEKSSLDLTNQLSLF